MMSRFKPHHTAAESTMVFDTHPCASADAAAQRVYGGSSTSSQQPVVCTTEEYSDIYGRASQELNHPTCGVCGGPPPLHTKFMQSLRHDYAHLDIRLAAHTRACRYVLVLSIHRPKQQEEPQIVVVPAALPEVHVNTSEPLPPPLLPPAVVIQVMPERTTKF